MMIRNGLLVFLLLSVAACAVEPGEGWGELAGEVRIAFDTRTDDETFPTSTNYALTFDEVQLTVEGVEFQAPGSSGTGEAIEFDPANPPPGYSLCHNGHCHADDGSLPSYDEVRERLRAEAGGTEDRLLTTLRVPQTALLPGSVESTDIRAPHCEPSCTITEMTSIHSVDMQVSRLQASGTVSDRRSVKRVEDNTPWDLDVDLDATLRAPVDIVIDEESEPIVFVDAMFTLNPRIFDREWADVVTPTTSSLPEEEEEQLIEALLNSEWSVDISH